MLFNNDGTILSQKATLPKKKHKIKVNAHNEWDPVEEIIVGIAANAKFPKNDKSIQVELALGNNGQTYKDVTIPDIPDHVIEETEEDLAIFVRELEKLGILVHRPNLIDTDQLIEQVCNY